MEKDKLINDILPRLIRVRQKFPAPPPVDIPAALEGEFKAQGVLGKLKPGARVAVAVGSRGITNLKEIVAEILGHLRSVGAQPFIVPAMGSHGGATSEGQTELLKEYGITEERMRAPVRASMEVERLGSTTEGIEVFCSAEALRSDGIVVVNRVKPHTDFAGNIGSGILKMTVIGLGKRTGAAAFHRTTSRVGYEQAIRSMAREVLRSAPILCGVAIVENQFHQTARLAVLKPDEIERREETLFQESKQLMPRLPFDEIDLLIVDRVGKNVSGAGMDPNIIGRGVHGYSSFLGEKSRATPLIRRIFARDLTPETHGNAIGIGFADFTTTRLVQAMNRNATYVNALTALTPNGAKIPIHFDTDREVLARALASLAIKDVAQARVVRIADTLSLEHLEVSEAYFDLVKQSENLEMRGGPEEIQFDARQNLLPVRTS